MTGQETAVLFATHVGLAKSIANKKAKGNNQLYEDYFQEASIGLLKAIRRYDPSLGYAFSSFACPYIRGSIAHYKRDKEPVVKPPRKLYEEAGFTFKQNAAMSQECLQMIRALSVISLDAAPSKYDKSSDCSEIGSEDTKREKLIGAVNELTDRLRDVIHRRFYLNQTIADVAEARGVTSMTIIRDSRKAISLLKTKLVFDPVHTPTANP